MNKTKKQAIHRPILITLPSNLDIGFTAVTSTSSYVFNLENPNDYAVQFLFESERFRIVPDRGQLGPGVKLSLTLTYAPTQAEVIVASVVLNLQYEEQRLFKVSGIGKYPFLQLNTKKLNFESLLIGKSVTKEITIKNQSEVTAQFVIQKVIDDEFKENAFNIDYNSGTIPPKSTFLIKVQYTPQILNVSVIRYRIFCQGGNELMFECIGTASQHQVYLSESSINFGEIKIGNQANKLLTVHNDSDLATSYSAYSDTTGVFAFNKTRGHLQAKGFDRIILTFTPKNTICYYERVFVIVSNQLLYIDLIGTCYDLLIKPIPLLQSHIDSFRRRVIQGMLSEVDFKYMENSYLMSNNKLSSNLQGDWAENPNQTVLFKELMMTPSNQNQLIPFSEDLLDFGYSEAMVASGQKEVELHNTLNCKLTIFWTIQNHPTIEGDKLPVFMVYPETQSVQARSSCKFQVSFRPTKSSYYYYQFIQFFAIKYNPKLTKKIIEEKKYNANDSFIQGLKLSQTMVSQRQQIQDWTSKEMIPTFSGKLACVGHSFGINSQPYIPILEFRPSQKLYFPPCTIQESVYQTVEFLNKSDTPIYYKFSPDTTRTFRVYPNQGLILGKQSLHLIIEFLPQENKAYCQTLTCHMNHQVSNSISLQVNGYCSSPALELQNEGKVFFPPSFVGVYSRQKVTVHNQSRVAMQYSIVIPEKYTNELYIEPPVGQIRPNETIHLDCQFIPYKKNKEYRIKVPFYAVEILSQTQLLIGYHIPGSGNPDAPLTSRKPTELEYQFEIFGAGSDGFLRLLQNTMDFGIIKVNFNTKKYATLVNDSNCTFYVELILRPKQKEKDKFDIAVQRQIEKSFTLDLQSGIIAANSKLDIGIMFNPCEVCEFSLVLDVIATEKNPKAPRGPNASHKKVVSHKCKLDITAKGSYPLLKIADVRNDSISVATLWENFQINQINQELAKDLNDDEQKFLKIEQLTFSEAEQLQKRLKSYDWNFGYLPSKPQVKSRKIVTTIQNIGGTELEWQFKLPSDHQIDLEPWADPGEPSEADTFEKAILEKNIFQIRPKSGVIAPGDFKDIELIYTPSNLDEELKKKISNESHFLRVVLQILNGKPLVLNLKGTTLAPLEGLLAVKKTSFTLPQTPVGLLQPVKYPIEIQNVGSSKVSYKTEVQELDEHESSIDSQFNVFDIQNPQGSLLPNEKQYLYCLFKPLEQKAYYFRLLIEVSDMVKVIQEVKLSISGRGYANEPMKIIHNPLAEIPRQRSHQSPIGSKVFFSLEEIDFGELLPLKSAHRMIILYNQSLEKKFNYDFGSSQFALSNNRPGLCCGDEFLIEPIQGELEPNSFVELKLTLTAASTPSVYEGECECSILWDTKQPQINTSQLSQNSQMISVDKETLFLRIKKRSSLNVELVNSFKQPLPPIHNPLAHPFQQLLSQIITEILTDSNTDQILKGIDQQPINIFAEEDDEQAIELQQQRDYKDYKTMFLEEEFIELTDLVMENTFFNIIQETTRKECDLLRISKTFVTPAK